MNLQWSKYDTNNGAVGDILTTAYSDDLYEDINSEDSGNVDVTLYGQNTITVDNYHTYFPAWAQGLLLQDLDVAWDDIDAIKFAGPINKRNLSADAETVEVDAVGSLDWFKYQYLPVVDGTANDKGATTTYAADTWGGLETAIAKAAVNADINNNYNIPDTFTFSTSSAGDANKYDKLKPTDQTLAYDMMNTVRDSKSGNGLEYRIRPRFTSSARSHIEFEMFTGTQDNPHINENLILTLDLSDAVNGTSNLGIIGLDLSDDASNGYNRFILRYTKTGVTTIKTITASSSQIGRTAFLDASSELTDDEVNAQLTARLKNSTQPQLNTSFTMQEKGSPNLSFRKYLGYTVHLTNAPHNNNAIFRIVSVKYSTSADKIGFVEFDIMRLQNNYPKLPNRTYTDPGNTGGGGTGGGGGGADDTKPTIQTTSLYDAAINQDYTGFILTEGSPVPKVTATGLPPGLDMDDTGKITGKPTKIGSYTLHVTATNRAGTDTADIVQKVTADWNTNTDTGDTNINNANVGFSETTLVGVKANIAADNNFEQLPQGAVVGNYWYGLQNLDQFTLNNNDTFDIRGAHMNMSAAWNYLPVKTVSLAPFKSMVTNADLSTTLKVATLANTSGNVKNYTTQDVTGIKSDYGTSLVVWGAQNKLWFNMTLKYAYRNSSYPGAVAWKFYGKTFFMTVNPDTGDLGDLTESNQFGGTQNPGITLAPRYNMAGILDREIDDVLFMNVARYEDYAYADLSGQSLWLPEYNKYAQFSTYAAPITADVTSTTEVIYRNSDVTPIVAPEPVVVLLQNVLFNNNTDTNAKYAYNLFTFRSNVFADSGLDDSQASGGAGVVLYDNDYFFIGGYNQSRLDPGTYVASYYTYNPYTKTIYGSIGSRGTFLNGTKTYNNYTGGKVVPYFAGDHDELDKFGTNIIGHIFGLQNGDKKWKDLGATRSYYLDTAYDDGNNNIYDILYKPAPVLAFENGVYTYPRGPYTGPPYAWAYDETNNAWSAKRIVRTANNTVHVHGTSDDPFNAANTGNAAYVVDDDKNLHIIIWYPGSTRAPDDYSQILNPYDVKAEFISDAYMIDTGDHNLWDIFAAKKISTLSFEAIETAGYSYNNGPSGYEHSLALDTDGYLYTWGWNAFRQLGRDNTYDSGNANFDKNITQVGTTKFKSISAGFQHSAAIDTDGYLWMWGEGISGKLGTGSQTNLNVPTKIGTKKWLYVEAGINATWAIDTDRKLWFTGNHFGMPQANGFQQVGTKAYIKVVTNTYGTRSPNAPGKDNFYDITFFIDIDGNLSVISNSQLANGIDNQASTTEETKLDFAITEFTDVATNGINSYVIDTDNDVYSVGLEQFNSTGTFTSFENSFEFGQVPGIKGRAVQSSTQGGLVIDTNNVLYAFTPNWQEVVGGNFSYLHPIFGTNANIKPPASITGQTGYGSGQVPSLPTSLPAGVKGQPYDYTIDSSGAGYPNVDFTINGLPPGITATPLSNKLHLTGTPTTSSVYVVHVTAKTTDASDPTNVFTPTNQKAYGLVVTNPDGSIG